MGVFFWEELKQVDGMSTTIISGIMCVPSRGASNDDKVFKSRDFSHAQ